MTIASWVVRIVGLLRGSTKKFDIHNHLFGQFLTHSSIESLKNTKLVKDYNKKTCITCKICFLCPLWVKICTTKEITDYEKSKTSPKFGIKAWTFHSLLKSVTYFFCIGGPRENMCCLICNYPAITLKNVLLHQRKVIVHKFIRLIWNT